MARLPQLPNFEEIRDFDAAVRVINVLLRYIETLVRELERELP